jgi:flagellar motor protein MotB
VDLKDKKKKNSELEKQLKKKKDDQKRSSQKARDEKKRKLNTLFEDNPELHTTLNLRTKHCWAKLEENQSSLLVTIIDIAMHASGTA